MRARTPFGSRRELATAQSSKCVSTRTLTAADLRRRRLSPPSDSSDDLGREPLELREVVVAGRQDHVLDAASLQITDALDDLRRGSEKVRLLEVLERPMSAHHALEDRALEPERLLAVGRVDQVEEVQVTVTQAVWIAPVPGEVVADRPDIVLDHLLVAGGAGEPAIGAGDPRQHRWGDVGLVGRQRGLDLRSSPDPQLGEARQEWLDRHVLEPVVPAGEAHVTLGQEAAERRDHLVGPPATLRELHAERLELVLVPARSDTEHEALARQVPERLDLASQRDRVVVGQDQEAGRQPDPRGDAGGVGEAEQRRHPHGAVKAGRLQEVLGDPERVEPEVVGLAGELLHAGGLVDAEIPPRERRQVHAESHRRIHQLTLALTATPAQRLAWLEEVTILAHRVGAPAATGPTRGGV